MNDQQIITDAKMRIRSGDWYGAANLLKSASGAEAQYIARLMSDIIAPDESIKSKILQLLDRQ